MAHQVKFFAAEKQAVLIFETKDDLHSFVVDMFRRLSRQRIEEAGLFHVALSGGATPVPLYRKLAESGTSLQWDRTHVFLVDERFVPPADTQSNYRMIRETLLDRVRIPSGNVHPVPTEGMRLDAAAKEYERELARVLKPEPGTLPAFDLVLLGLGEDGHTASLFPGAPPFDERERFVRPVAAAGDRVARVTLTLPVINTGRNILFIVAGGGKAGVVKRVVEERDPALPASHVEARSGEVLFLCDREAASQLSADRLEGQA